MARWLAALPDEAATARLGAALAGVLQRGDVIALSGDLGAGKTALARALIVTRLGPVEVPSPTFNLVLTYEPTDDGATIWHFDLYRLAEPDEVWELGLEEALADGIALIEWPERLGGNLPRHALRVALRHADGGRAAVIAGDAAWAARLGPVAAAEKWQFGE